MVEFNDYLSNVKTFDDLLESLNDELVSLEDVAEDDDIDGEDVEKEDGLELKIKKIKVP